MNGEAIEENILKMNISTQETSTFGTALVVSGVAILLTTGPLIVYTFITSSPDNMKTCEKLIVCNVLFPDLLLGVLLTRVLGPVLSGMWTYNTFMTRWLGFLHTASVFYGHFAMAFVGHIISMSLRDVYRFESANNMKLMSALVLSVFSLVVCFCSLPATEKEGYTYVQSWLGPWFNVHYQFGSVFMLLALFGLMIPLDFSNIVQIIKVKQSLKDQGAKVTEHAMAEMNKIVQFAVITLFTAFLIVPTVLGVENKRVMLVARVVAYACPIFRVFTLWKMCPHFTFGRSAVTDVNLSEDFAKLGEEDIDDDLGSEKFESYYRQ